MTNAVSIIIVAGGSGTRMGSSLPKQFLQLNDKPIFIHTLESFIKALPNAQYILVMPAAHIQTAQSLLNEYLPSFNVLICAGGYTRFHSVKNGLKHVTQSITMVHDAVRPFIPSDLIERLVMHCTKQPTAIPAIDVVESLRWLEEGKNTSMDRSKVKIIQTPQVFQTPCIQAAYNTEFKDLFTDDASVIEHAGYTIDLIEGYKHNIKITTPEDIAYAYFLLNSKP